MSGVQRIDAWHLGSGGVLTPEIRAYRPELNTSNRKSSRTLIPFFDLVIVVMV